MLTVDWGNKIIDVPKSYTQFVQTEPITGLEVRQLDTDQFRLDLKALEASEEGMPYLDTHEHVAPKTLSGVTYARFVEIINGYTIRFEDGQYAVNLNGSNNNIADVAVVNQVSIRPNNSAGLTFSEEILSQSFLLGRVYINDDTGQPGTQFPAGTPKRPSDNLADTQTIMNKENLTDINLTTHVGLFMLTNTDNIDYTNWYGATSRTSRLFLGGASALNASFEGMELSGTLGTGPASLLSGTMSNVINWCGIAKEVGLNGNIILNNTSTQSMIFLNCFSEQAGTGRPVLDLNGTPADINIRGYIGGLTIKNMTGNNKVSFDGLSSTLELDSTCTNGTINVGGMTELIDNSTGTTVNTSRSITTLSGGSGGLTPEQSAQILEMWQLMGLDSNNVSTITRTSRTVAGVEVKITQNGDGSVTLTRI